MAEVNHPKWCDVSRCGVKTTTTRSNMHRSPRMVGRFDPDEGVSVDVSLWKVHGKQTNVLIEFPAGRGEGNDISAVQAAELADMIRSLVSKCSPEEFEPSPPADAATFGPLPLEMPE